MKKKLIRIEDVATMTGISVNTWRYWIHVKKEGIPMPAKLGGRRLVWTEEQIDSWLSAEFEKANEKAAG